MVYWKCIIWEKFFLPIINSVYEKVWFTINGPSKMLLFNFLLFRFSKFQMAIQKSRRRLVLDLFLFFKKNFIWDKSRWSSAYFQYIRITLNLVYNKSKLCKPLDFRLLVQSYAQFWLFKKVSENNFFTTFSIWFLKKNIFLLYSINWPNFIFWLPLLLEMLGKNVYCNCLITSLWHHKFWLKLTLSF